MFQDVFIIGATGKVGKTLVSQIYGNGDLDTTRHRNPTRVIGLASRKKFIFNTEGIPPEQAQAFAEQGRGADHEGVQSFLNLSLDPHTTFIDVTAEDRMLQFHVDARDRGYNIVTANKNPLVDGDFNTFKRLTRNPQHYGYRCSVMAGAEAVDKIRDLRDLDDLPIEISGCFSGTLGYVSSELEKGRKLSEIVLEARQRGYTEPNPADDLSGRDVARKILILARTAGYDPKGEQFYLEPFVPQETLCENPDEFLSRLPELDERFARRVEHARTHEQVLRYVATFSLNGEPKIDVRLCEVPKESPLGSLTGTRNKIVIRSRTYDPQVYSVEAPGAGLEITAQNIRRDLLHQLANRDVSY